MKKRRIKKLNLSKGTVSNLEKVNGGKAAGTSVTVCKSDFCTTKFQFCPPE